MIKQNRKINRLDKKPKNENDNLKEIIYKLEEQLGILPF